MIIIIRFLTSSTPQLESSQLDNQLQENAGEREVIAIELEKENKMVESCAKLVTYYRVEKTYSKAIEFFPQDFTCKTHYPVTQHWVLSLISQLVGKS